MIGQRRTLVLILDVLSSKDRRYECNENQIRWCYRSSDYIHNAMPGPAVGSIVMSVVKPWLSAIEWSSASGDNSG